MPALVQLRCTNTYCKALGGIRAQGKLMLYANKQMITDEIGEIQLTDYGISGIPVFQISGLVNRLLNAKNKVIIKIDFFPNYTNNHFKEFIQNRLLTLKEVHLSIQQVLT